MNMLFNIKEKPNKDTILVFNGEEFVPVKKEILFDEFYKLRKEFDDLQREFNQLKRDVAYDEGKITREEYENGRDIQ